MPFVEQNVGARTGLFIIGQYSVFYAVLLEDFEAVGKSVKPHINTKTV
jgi:hypothetical protein